MRVVSLLASCTEMAAALGCEQMLVGRSHECDYPSAVLHLPVCTAPKFQTDGRSYEIDQRVKAILQEGLSVYRVDAARLKSLRPDVILTQSHCEVCAVSERDVEQAVADWLDYRPRIVSLAPNTLADVWSNIQTVANALDVPERGRELVAALQQRVAAIVQKAGRAPYRLTIACIEWIDPLMAAGNWMPELVDMAGGVNLFGVAGKHSPWMTWEELKERDPEVIVVLPCGFDIERTRQEMPALSERPDWKNLRAARTNCVYLADGNQFFNRPGPRLVESLEILAEILHPTEISFGHEGKGWQRLAHAS